jgi:hypothetical protein
MLSVAFYCYADHGYAECHSAKCCYGDCRGAVIWLIGMVLITGER